MPRKTHLYNSDATVEYIENYEYEVGYEDNQGTESIYCLRMPVLIKVINLYGSWEMFICSTY